jgi:hypothetical protein
LEESGAGFAESEAGLPVSEGFLSESTIFALKPGILFAESEVGFSVSASCLGEPGAPARESLEAGRTEGCWAVVANATQQHSRTSISSLLINTHGFYLKCIKMEFIASNRTKSNS